MGVQKYLDASTGHITYEDNHKLFAQHQSFPTRVVSHQHGWWINVPEKKLWEDELIASQIQAQGYSKDFLALLLFAVKHGCWWVNLDCDGSYIEGLNSFDW